MHDLKRIFHIFREFFFFSKISRCKKRLKKIEEIKLAISVELTLQSCPLIPHKNRYTWSLNLETFRGKLSNS